MALGRRHATFLVKRKEHILKFWMKIISIKNILLYRYRVYKLELEMLETDNNNTVISWVEQVKNLLCELGLTFLWDSQCMTNLQLQIHVVIKRLYDQYMQS